jgi:hypothetical protein
MGWIRALILGCAATGVVAAQTATQYPGAPTLQLNTPIERTISTGQTHVYQIVADENTYVQLVVEQRGIDVVVRIYNPNGKKPSEYDSPNGNDGPENVSFVTASKSPYRIEVTPLGRDIVPAGKYEIRLIEQRPATEQEIKDSSNQEALKARALALISEVEGLIAELRLPQTRIKTQMQVAGMLWDTDEKRALKYVTDATTGFKELMSAFDVTGKAYKDYSRVYYLIMNLRHEIIQILIYRQPEMALSFIRSNPPLPDPYGNQRDIASNEAALEMEIANQLIAKDPKRTFEIARENLKTRYSSALTNTIINLRQKNPEMAAELATEVANKLLRDKTKNSQTAGLMIGLIQMTGPAAGNQGGDSDGVTRRPPLLSDQLRRDLYQRAVNDALAFKTPFPNMNFPERDYAWSLLSGLQQLGTDVDTIANGSAAAVSKKIQEFSGTNNNWQPLQEFQNALNDTNMPVEQVIQILSKAPKEQRDQLFVQLSNRVLNNGDPARAKQIINDYISTPFHRQQALLNIETQEMYRSMAKGKIEDALRNIANMANPQERAQALVQMANQIGPGYKRSAVIMFLDQARALLPESLQAQDQTQMQALCEIAKAYSRYDSKRAFEIVDPLVDQFNELSAAARTLEGFGGEYYEQEELNMQNGNVIANVATQLTATLGTLALTNFDRAKATADRMTLPEVRLRAYLDIALIAIQNAR